MKNTINTIRKRNWALSALLFLTFGTQAQTVMKVMVNQPKKLEIVANSFYSLTSNAIILGDNVSIKGGIEPYQYFWLKDGQRIGTSLLLEVPLQKPAASSSFTLIVKDYKNCSSTTTSIVLNVIDVTAGGLKELLGTQISTINNLILTGTIDARDFKTMRDNMPLLTEIDLSGATIVAYNGTEGTSFSDFYPADAVPERAFQEKTNLKTVILPSSVKSTSNYAFAFCSGLTLVTLPEGLTSIASGTFHECSSITAFNIPSSVNSIGYGAFYNGRGQYIVDADNQTYSSLDGVLFNKNKTTLIQCPVSKTGSYSIPPSVNTIGGSAFMNCIGITGTLTIPLSVNIIEAAAFTGCIGLTSVIIPSSVTSIGNGVFSNCTNLSSITANSGIPIDLSSSWDVFYDVNKTSCTLYVPFGTSGAYKAADKWKDFTNIMEMTGLFPSANSVVFGANASTTDFFIASSMAWTAVSSEAWLTINPTSHEGSSSVALTVTNNTTTTIRTATVTVSGAGIDDQIIRVTQYGAIVVTAGGLSATLGDQLPAIASLTLTGTIDARDFKTMRDNMPLLSNLDLSGATIVAYSGTGGTSLAGNNDYPANTIPETAFMGFQMQGKTSLTSFVLPTSATAIGNMAFGQCMNLSSVILSEGLTFIGESAFMMNHGLTSITIPSSVTTIQGSAFFFCRNISSITANPVIPVDLSSSGDVFNGINTTTCTLHVPFGTTAAYQSANQWKDFFTIVEIPEFKLSASTANVAATSGSTVTVNITTGLSWTASSNQTWLTVNPISGTGNQTLTFTAESNPQVSERTAIVTVSATDVTSQTITVTQAAKIIVYNHFIPVWTGNGVDHMNINIYSAKLDGVELEAGDEIGIFDGTICVGVGTLTEPITSLNTLDIAVSKNDGTGNGYTSGNSITFKLFDSSQNLEMTNVTAIYSNTDPSWSNDGKFAIGATAFAELSGLTKVNQEITLNTGWNIISANVIPSNLNLKDIFQSLIDAGKLKKVMDEAGKTIENFGAFGGWKNNIGNLNPAKGYKVNVLSTSTLSLEGTPVSLPLDLALATGWNIISYSSATAQDAKALVQSLIDAGKLKKVMDEAGKTIENFGAFGGWKNNIGNFLPGKGYKVNVHENCTLTIPATANKAATIVPEVLASTHFTKVYTGNGTDHMNIHLVNLQASGLQTGDQIGIYDGKLCVGSQTIGAEDVMSGVLSIPASANDGIGESLNGFIVGNRVSVKLYRDGQTYPLTLAKLDGQDIFDKNASLFAQVSIAGATGINDFNNEISFRCYPNPFSGQVTIEIQSTSSDKLEVNIYDLNGKLVRKLYSGKTHNQGTLVWDGRNDGGARVVQGTYLINANGRIEKVVLKH